jgi:hypothetical protein
MMPSYSLAQLGEIAQRANARHDRDTLAQVLGNVRARGLSIQEEDKLAAQRLALRIQTMIANLDRLARMEEVADVGDADSDE